MYSLLDNKNRIVYIINPQTSIDNKIGAAIISKDIIVAFILFRKIAIIV